MKAFGKWITNFEFLMEFETFRLDNGLRVLFLQTPSAHTVHCGFLINAGSRDESDNEHGLAHLIEHCLFKGTNRRKAFHILSRLDAVGGELNAYTTKEETCIYASVLKEHFDRATELLFDIVFSPNFPVKEINKERSVIKDEINSYKDNPDEQILDEFEERLFPNHALGRSILGTDKALDTLDRMSIQTFVNRLYSTDHIVFACVGNVTRKKVEAYCKTLSGIPARKRINAARTVPKPEGFELVRNEKVHQVHAMIGGTAVGLNDESRREMLLLNNVLGGPALNSRLNLNIREKFGYCYYIESSYNPYTDIGVFEIYFGTDKAHFNRTLKLVRNELKTMADNSLTPRALVAAKKQLLGQIALAQEQLVNMMLSAGKSLLHFDAVDSYEEIEAKVMGISSESVRLMAEQVFASDNQNLIAYMPAE
ncbi:MAG: pitrilysin family protein [Flavobacteriales bacterium]